MNRYSMIAFLWSFISVCMLLRAIFYERVASFMGYVKTTGFGQAQIIETVIWIMILAISVKITHEWWDK